MTAPLTFQFAANGNLIFCCVPSESVEKIPELEAMRPIVKRMVNENLENKKIILEGTIINKIVSEVLSNMSLSSQISGEGDKTYNISLSDVVDSGPTDVVDSGPSQRVENFVQRYISALRQRVSALRQSVSALRQDVVLSEDSREAVDGLIQQKIQKYTSALKTPELNHEEYVVSEG